MELGRTRAVSAARPARSRNRAAVSSTEPELGSARAVAAPAAADDLNLAPIVAAETKFAPEIESDDHGAPPASLSSDLFLQIAGEAGVSPASQARAYLNGKAQAPAPRRGEVIA